MAQLWDGDAQDGTGWLGSGSLRETGALMPRSCRLACREALTFTSQRPLAACVLAIARLVFAVGVCGIVLGCTSARQEVRFDELDASSPTRADLARENAVLIASADGDESRLHFPGRPFPPLLRPDQAHTVTIDARCVLRDMTYGDLTAICLIVGTIPGLSEYRILSLSRDRSAKRVYVWLSYGLAELKMEPTGWVVVDYGKPVP